VKLETGIVYMMGGTEPVAREKFLLLSKSIKELLIEAAAEPAIKQSVFAEEVTSAKLAAQTDQAAAVTYLLFRDTEPFSGPTQRALSAATVAQVTTGFDGKGTFEPVPVGSYFVFGLTLLRGDKVPRLWCVPVQVKRGEQTVVLDQNNLTTGVGKGH
jgi:hypothetical protein